MYYNDRKDYTSAIADFTKAVQADSRYAVAYIIAGWRITVQGMLNTLSQTITRRLN